MAPISALWALALLLPWSAWVQLRAGRLLPSLLELAAALAIALLLALVRHLVSRLRALHREIVVLSGFVPDDERRGT